MKRVKKLVAVAGSYTSADGQERKRYHNCGFVLERADGSRAMKVDSVPVNWDGWLNEYDLDPPKEQPSPQGISDKSVPF